MKYCLTILLFSFVFCLQLKSAETESAREYYRKNKSTLIKSRFAINGNFVYVVGICKKIGSDETTLELAESDSFFNLIYLKKHDFINSFSGITAKPLKYFLNWLTFHDFKYTAKNRIELDSFIKGQYAYYAAAYKLSDVEFEDKTSVTWKSIYNDFKKNPGKRDELLFYEIIPQNELPALKDVVENNIAKQYGKNFALMFMGKKVPPIPQKRYDIAKKASEKYNSKTSLKILIIAADTLPYDQNICNLLAEKFENMQMPRSAAIMKIRAGESPKLIIEQPPAAATVSKSEPPQDRNTAPQNIIEGTKAASVPQKTPKNQTGKTTPGSDINFTNLL